MRNIHFVIPFLFIITSCTKTISVKAPRGYDSQIMQSERNCIVNNVTDKCENTISIIGGYSFEETPEELILLLHREHISDTFLPSNPVESRFKLPNGNTLKCKAHYYFDENRQLALVNLDILSSVNKYDFINIFGHPQFTIKSSRKNDRYKYIWIKNNVIYSYYLNNDKNDFLAICKTDNRGTVNLDDFDAIDALIYAYKNSNHKANVYIDECHLGYDGKMFTINRGNKRFTSNNADSVRNNLHKMLLNNERREYDDVVEDVIISLYWDRSYYHLYGLDPDRNNRSEQEILNSIQREKIMRDAGFQREADQERNNRWKSY